MESQESPGPATKDTLVKVVESLPGLADSLRPEAGQYRVHPGSSTTAMEHVVALAWNLRVWLKSMNWQQDGKGAAPSPDAK